MKTTLHEVYKRAGRNKYGAYEEVSLLKGEVGKIAPNLLERDFNAEKPSQKRVADLNNYNIRRKTKAEGPNTCSTQMPGPSGRVTCYFI